MSSDGGAIVRGQVKAAGGAPLRALDECSGLALLDAAATLGAIEAVLGARELSLGPVPVESRARTLGAALASPRPSESTPAGRVVDRCAALEALLPDGTAITTRLAPRKATGPDYMAALIGARGATGRITAAWMRVKRRPPMTSFMGFAVRDGGAALAAAWRLLTRGVLPSEVALLDAPLAGSAAEAAVREATGGATDAARAEPPAGAVGPTLVLLRLDGARELVLASERVAAELFAAGTPLAPRLAEDLLLRREPLRLAERFVPSEMLAAAWSARRAPAALLGLRHAGAAYCTAATAALPAVEAPSPLVGALNAALQQALVPPISGSGSGSGSGKREPGHA